MKLLEIKNLNVFFKTVNNEEFQAVNNVSLKLDEGEILGIVGESGSGKSVTSLSILGLLPYPKAYHDEKSSIMFQNQELIGMNNVDFQKIRGNQISFIFQEPMSSLNPLHKIGKQIAEAIKLHQNLTKSQINQRVIELLKLVKIPNPEQKAKAYPFELSGGQRQRVMIAMAIANNPKILIADEPTTALDVTIQEQIIELLLELKQKLKMSVIFISHNLRLVHKIADNIAVMHQGRVVEYGSSDEVFNNPQDDYTKTLIYSSLVLNKKKNIKNNTLLKCEKIKVEFPIKKNIFGKVIQKLTAVNNVSFELEQGETLGIVGESGSGKTTLASSLVGLNKYSGKIYIKNNKIFEEIKDKITDIQIVFQDPYNSLNPRMKVGDIIAEGLDIKYKGITKLEKQAKLMEILQSIGLEPSVAEKYPHEFSGGQRQRIALARALIIRPKILVLDEPTSALDMAIQVQIIELLKKLQAEFNLSYIFISHDMHAVRAMSQKIMVMKDGKVVEFGSADEIFNHPKHNYTKQLITAAMMNK